MVSEKYLVRYRVETDDEDKGEYDTHKAAVKTSTPQDYIIEVKYRAVKTRIIKAPVPRVEPEIKRSDWLVLSSDAVKRFCIDLSDLELTADENKDPMAHCEAICARYGDYLPFLLIEDIKVMTIQRKKFGARLVGEGTLTTEWVVCNTAKDAKAYLLKTHKVKVHDDAT